MVDLLLPRIVTYPASVLGCAVSLQRVSSVCVVRHSPAIIFGVPLDAPKLLTYFMILH